MFIYLISQTENNDYDTYDSAVVCARDEEEARNINPDKISKEPWAKSGYSTWASSPDKVSVEYLGEAKPDSVKGIILSSFNAG